MIKNEQQLKNILLVLQKENILENTILIGSWCLLFYKYIFENFSPTVRTSDIDFYVPNAKSINEKDNLVRSLKMINFDPTYDILTNKTKFISPDGFELEFLTKLNRNNSPCVQLGNTKIYAESISYLEIYSANYIEVNYDGILVKVASPASYILQKLLINQRRTPEKQEKDIESIKNVLPYILISKKYSAELKGLFESLPKKWKKKIVDIINQNDIKFEF